MQLALDTFNLNMNRVRMLHGLHASFSSQTTAAIDLSDILRAEVVLAVSAMDQYVHDLVRLGMIDCWRRVRTQTDAFRKFQITAGSAFDMLANNSQAENLFENEIRNKHGFSTFQQPDKIADAVRLFSGVVLWDRVGSSLGITAGSAKSALALIVDRRNKIAHEADIDPTYPGQRWPIDRIIVENMLNTIDKTVVAIHTACA